MSCAPNNPRPDGWYYRTVTIWGGRYNSAETYDGKTRALTFAQLTLSSGAARSVTLIRRRDGVDVDCGEIRPRRVVHPLDPVRRLA